MKRIGILVLLSLAPLLLSDQTPGTGEAWGNRQGPPCDPSSLSREHSDKASQMESKILERINRIRKDHGLESLEVEDSLVLVARRYSCRMATEDFFGHTGPAGRSAAERVRDAGLTYTAMGENIGMSRGVADPVETIVQGWMESEGHRENIVKGGFTQTGIGVWEKGDSFYVTQIFLRP
jgi:uncharacterized protein YkwD